MILVTGGAGFIGSNIVRGLNKEGVTDILIVDNLENSRKHLNLNSLDFVDFIDKIDFIENVEKFAGSINFVFHQGACTNTMEYNGKYMMKNNYEYSKKIFQFVVKNGINLIYASSASVYGFGKNGFTEIEDNEYPLNIYAFSKFLFDRYVRKNFNKFKISVIGLRYFNVYGPQEMHKGKMASVVYNFHQQILNSNEIRLFKGSENFKRDFIYIDDVVKVNLFFYRKINEGFKIQDIINCGTGKARSFKELAEIMINNRVYKNRKIEIKYIEFPEILKGKYQAYTKADLRKLKSYGYNNRFVELEEGIDNYIKILWETGGFYF